MHDQFYRGIAGKKAEWKGRYRGGGGGGLKKKTL